MGGLSGESTEFDRQLLALGKLHFLAGFCPLHRRFPGAGLARIFVPAVNADCVRFFDNDAGQVCAAVIWARLSDEVSERMLFDQTPPEAAEWTAGRNLWFLDILAPFDHGRIVARHIARDPPQEPFYYARLGKAGAARKVVRGDLRAGARDRVRAFGIAADGKSVA
ncbi:MULTISPECIES: toxin-activating lysine-acyltransferase [unclassified Roseovarius]|uniref:toxin-activating lysine-acyltransferase n=1 Tax=unclassified Roseovarius TaxID=2614913 RepID=UPI00273D537C|nr:toxin-activating lysine-acyltransferase [Roseovarius sp. MMSF_3350]